MASPLTRRRALTDFPSSPSCIGRDVVLAALDEWLEAPRAGMVWWLHGIGGIGKTQVARALAARVLAEGRRVAWVDGLAVEPSPRGVCGLPKALIAGDPLCSAWSRHLDDEPVQPGEQVLVMRSKLCAEGGEALSPTDAALTLDLKRAYLELRPKLRRLY